MTSPAKRHSRAITDGPDRAGARSMLKGVGFTDEDLAKPLIGVATTWIETMPCNLNQRELAQDVKRGIREAGGTPMEFNTIAISDGVSMTTEELHELESVACPGAGACGGQFTANTMSTILEFLGLSPAGANGIPALSKRKPRAAEEAGRLAVELVRRDVRLRQIVTREAL